MFEEFVFYDNVQFMLSTSVGAGEYMVKGELEVRLRLLRLCIWKGRTAGTFTLGTGCSAHGYTGMRLIMDKRLIGALLISGGPRLYQSSNENIPL